MLTLYADVSEYPNDGGIKIIYKLRTFRPISRPQNFYIYVVVYLFIYSLIENGFNLSYFIAPQW